MYSPEIQQLLDDKDIEVGDRIKVNSREGNLMPKPESGSEGSIILKLDSGYNVGLEPEEVELVEKKEETPEIEREVQHSDDKPDILILHTGGTIASRVSYEEGGVKPAFEPEELVGMYPTLKDICNMHSEVIAQMLSEDMEPAHWIQIAEKINEVKDEYDGIIVGHGTDTMGYTGAALSVMLNGIDTGVMIVGSQRSSDRPSSDAQMNMHCAAKFLSETDFTGIGVCMHESSNDSYCEIIHGAKARKMHTSRRDAFESINAEPVGKVNYQEDEVVETNFEDTNEEYDPDFELNENVGFLKVRPGMTVEELKFLEDQDYDGIVIEGTGLGHMPVNSFDDETEHHDQILEKVGELSENAVVVMASQCLNGRIDMNVYDAGRMLKDNGVIEAGDMHPELAYVKLMWALAQDGDTEQLFSEDVAGELGSRSLYSE